MIKKSTFQHARFIFSILLMPVWFFALGMSPNFNPLRVLMVFIILHVFLYPASNAYNSYYDKDEESIGLLKNPPKVTKQLLYFAWFLDIIAIILGAIYINHVFVLCLLAYGFVSKAYSHPAIRLKKYPIISLIAAGFFQGAFTYQMSYIGINDFGWGVFERTSVWYPALLSTALLVGSYPITQVYQHKEDARRGDMTMSRLLGIKGTFIWVALVFTVASLGFTLWFESVDSRFTIKFWLFLLPVLGFFNYWAFQVFKDVKKADYKRTMWMNWISALMLNGFFVYMFLERSQLLQLI